MSSVEQKPRIALPWENHPWLKYFSIMAIPAGAFWTLGGLTRFDLNLVVGPLAIASSFYTLRKTTYFRYWETISGINKAIGWFCVLNGVIISLITFFIIPFFKPFTDQLGQGEPRKFNNQIDDLVTWFRRVTNDPSLLRFDFTPPPPAQAKPSTKTEVVGTGATLIESSRELRGEDQMTKDTSSITQGTSIQQPLQSGGSTSKSWLSRWLNYPRAPNLLDDTKIYRIKVPKGTVWQPERALSLIEHILATLGRTTFQIVAQEGRVFWQLVDIQGGWTPSVITKAICSIYPEAEVEVLSYKPPEVAAPFERQVVLCKQAGDFIFPLKYVSELKKIDPLTTMVHNMAGLETARVIYTLHVESPLSDNERKSAFKRTTRLVINTRSEGKDPGEVAANVVVSTLMSFVAQKREPKFEPRVQQLIEARLGAEPLYTAYLIQQIESPDLPDDEEVGGMYGALTSLDHFKSDFNALTIPAEIAESNETFVVENQETERATNTLGLISAWVTAPNAPGMMVLSPEELAAFWHLPHEGFATDKIGWTPLGKVAAPPELAKNRTGILIGDNLAAGRTNPIYLLLKDRETHMNIVGKTRVGKSTLMHHLIHQDIAAGRGVAVIDPHGTLFRDILRSSIPEGRRKDVVLIDIADEQCPPALNPLARPKGLETDIAVGQVIAVLEKIYGRMEITPRIVDTLSVVLMTLWQEETPTVQDVSRLFADLDYRYRLLDQLDDPVAEEFWSRYDNASPSRQDELADPVIRRMRAFYRNRFLRPIMCHPDPLDFVQLIEEGKIILVSLKVDNKRIPPPEQRLLGALLISQLQMAGMESRKDRAPFYLYIDEAQDFVTTALQDVLSGAGKFGLHLIMANQFLRQLEGPLLDAVIGNVGTTAAFQVGLDDAKVLAHYFRPEFSDMDLMNMDLYNAAIKTRFDGKTLPAFSIQTSPPIPEPPDADERERLIREYAAINCKTRQQILDWLDQRYPRTRRSRGKQEGGEEGERDWVDSD